MKRSLIVFALILLAPFFDSSSWLFALQDGSGKQQSQREVKVKPTIDQTSDITSELKKINKNLQKVHKSQLLILDSFLLQIELNRVERIETRISDIDQRIDSLETQEKQLNLRLRNIESEIITVNTLNRSDAERIIRTSIDNQLAAVGSELNRLRLEKPRLEQQLSEAMANVEKIRNRLGLNGSSLDSALEDENKGKKENE